MAIEHFKSLCSMKPNQAASPFCVVLVTCATALHKRASDRYKCAEHQICSVHICSFSRHALLFLDTINQGTNRGVPFSMQRAQRAAASFVIPIPGKRMQKEAMPVCGRLLRSSSAPNLVLDEQKGRCPGTTVVQVTNEKQVCIVPVLPLCTCGMIVTCLVCGDCAQTLHRREDAHLLLASPLL